MAQDQVTIANRDIPAPGHDDPSIVAWRAGDVIHPAWAEHHAAYLKELAADGGPEAIRTVPASKAGQASEQAMREQAGEPSRVTPTVP